MQHSWSADNLTASLLLSLSLYDAASAAALSVPACLSCTVAVVAQVSPNTLFFIEGCGQLGYSMCWGDGFVTDPGTIAQFGLTDPKPFFNTVLTRPYANQVVISPHYYPPSISGQTFKCVLPHPLHDQARLRPSVFFRVYLML